MANKTNEGKQIIILLVVLILLLFVIVFGIWRIVPNGLFGEGGFDITVVNETHSDVQGLKITYNNIDEAVPVIPAGQVYEFNITPSEEFGENTMYIYYSDNNGVMHERTMTGYFEKKLFWKSNYRSRIDRCKWKD